MSHDPEASSRSYRAFYGEYHNHKELLAYGAATLYLTAVTWVIINGPCGIGPSPKSLIMVLLNIAGVSVSFAFVCWQLKNRRIASEIVAGCNAVLAKAANSIATDSRTHAGIPLPQYLVDAITQANERRTWQGTPRISTVVTLVAMGLWTILAIVHLYCGV